MKSKSAPTPNMSVTCVRTELGTAVQLQIGEAYVADMNFNREAFGETEANEIARRFNAYDDLVEALEGIAVADLGKLKEYSEAHLSKEERESFNLADTTARYSQHVARKLLTKAKGEEE